MLFAPYTANYVLGLCVGGLGPQWLVGGSDNHTAGIRNSELGDRYSMRDVLIANKSCVLRPVS
ncbi:hypothetical protein J3E61_006625 [Mycobacterium sp. OAE908]